MSESIPVNPDILRWARITAGYSVEDVISKIKQKRVTAETFGYSVEDVVSKIKQKRIIAETLESWEKGTESPTYVQLEKLAYTIYKRPLALFFFPEPPQEESPKQSFRTLPEEEITTLTPRMRYLIKQGRVMQLNLAELYGNVNPVPRQIIRDLKFQSNVSLAEMAKKVREFLNISLDNQATWKNLDKAFKSWRNVLYDNGVFVFKEAFRSGAFSGFCLYDEQYPIIYVNNSKSESHQIFTLFHELAHLLLGTGGVDTRLEDYIHFLEGEEKAIEILCNRFGGEFLVPDYDFNKRMAGISLNDNSIQNLANRYCVSREVILRKFLDNKVIDGTYYAEKVEEWATIYKRKSKNGGNYYLTMGAYLGEHYLEKAFRAYHQKRISVEQLADYLGVKAKNVTGMELLLIPKAGG